MKRPYAEVIGDPIGHSRSPTIHRYWLEQLGIDADYEATWVMPAELSGYLAARRDDPHWRGCNVTIPHKQAVMPLLDAIDAQAAAIGAVNCVLRGEAGLIGRNSDIDGIAAALDGADLADRKVALIGAGGAARAAVRYLLDSDVAEIALIVRNPEKAREIVALDPAKFSLHPFDQSAAALAGAAAIINASPLGMSGAAPMPPHLLDAIAANAAGTILFDMVYQPLETHFLKVGREHRGIPVDGLAMLIGQARAVFEGFFGERPPDDQGRLRALLAT